MEKRLKIGLLFCSLTLSLPLIGMNQNDEIKPHEKKIEEKIILNNSPKNTNNEKIIKSSEILDKKKEYNFEGCSNIDTDSQDLSSLVNECNKAFKNINLNQSYYYDISENKKHNSSKNSPSLNESKKYPQPLEKWDKEHRRQKNFDNDENDDSTIYDTLSERSITLINFCQKASDSDGNTIVHYAAKSDNTEIMEYFAENIDINKKNNIGKAPIDIAIENKNQKMVLFLVKHGAQVTPQTFGLLKELDINPLNMSNDNFNAITINEILYIKMLMSILKNNDLDDKQKTSLFKSNFFKNRNNNILSDGCGLIHCAAGKNLKEITELILNNRGNVLLKNDEGLQAIHLAARRGFDDVIKILVKFNADINAKSDLGTPLTLAVKGKFIPTIKFLISCNPNQETINEALEYALQNNLIELVPFLTSSGGKIKDELMKDKSTLPALVHEIHRQMTETTPSFEDFEKNYLTTQKSEKTIAVINEFTPHYKNHPSFKKFKKSLGEWESKSKKKKKSRFLSFDGIFPTMSLTKSSETKKTKTGNKPKNIFNFIFPKKK